MLTAREYHDLKLTLLIGKCDTHGELDACNSACSAIDRAIAAAWQFSEMANVHELTDEECTMGHAWGRPCRMCRRCRQFIGPDDVAGVCKRAPLPDKR